MLLPPCFNLLVGLRGVALAGGHQLPELLQLVAPVVQNGLALGAASVVNMGLDELTQLILASLRCHSPHIHNFCVHLEAMAIFQQLITDLPAFLFIPEESTPRYYAYTAPFYSFLFHTDLGTDASVYNYYPNAFGANLRSSTSGVSFGVGIST